MNKRNENYKELINSLAFNIYHYREQAKMTQEQLGIKCDMSASNISRIESGQIIPNAVQIKCIATALKTNVASLYNESLPNITDPSSHILYRFTDTMISMHNDMEVLAERMDRLDTDNTKLSRAFSSLAKNIDKTRS